MTETRFLLVGLGNPGREYHLSRHNIGFFFLDHLAETHNVRIETLKMQGLYCQGRVRGYQVFYLKPQTYMNRSGECVRSFVDYFKIPLNRLLVLHDDIDLNAGRVKIVGKGGAGGHNGVRSLAQHLGTSDFARLKIGVGRPVLNESGYGQPVDQFVLARMSEAELALFAQRKPLVEEAVNLFLREGIDRCMNRINGR
jgi:PTH1 family peptidyl-tRNA hydrolase